jgi:hypothetical protein
MLIRHAPEGGVVYEVFCRAFGCTAESGPLDEHVAGRGGTGRWRMPGGPGTGSSGGSSPTTPGSRLPWTRCLSIRARLDRGRADGNNPYRAQAAELPLYLWHRSVRSPWVIVMLA